MTSGWRKAEESWAMSHWAVTTLLIMESEKCLWLVNGAQDSPLIGLHHQWQLLTAVIWIVKCGLHCEGQWWSVVRRKWWQLSWPDIWPRVIHFRYLQYWPGTMGDKDLRAAAEDGTWLLTNGIIIVAIVACVVPSIRHNNQIKLPRLLIAIN